MSVAQAEFVQQMLVTDSVIFEVVGRTAKTLKLRRTQQGDTLRREDNGSPYPTVYVEALPDPDAETITVRLRNDGTYRPRNGKPLSPACLIDGNPASRTDYSF